MDIEKEMLWIGLGVLIGILLSLALPLLMGSDKPKTQQESEDDDDMLEDDD